MIQKSNSGKISPLDLERDHHFLAAMRILKIADIKEKNSKTVSSGKWCLYGHKAVFQPNVNASKQRISERYTFLHRKAMKWDKLYIFPMPSHFFLHVHRSIYLGTYSVFT